MVGHLHWLHCNKCGTHATPNPRTTTKFFLCSCQDVLCQKCLKKSPAASVASKKSCILCNKEVFFCLIGNTMGQGFKKFFAPAKNLIKLSLDDMSKVASFQMRQKDRSLKFVMSNYKRSEELVAVAKKKFAASNGKPKEKVAEPDEELQRLLKEEAELDKEIARMMKLVNVGTKQLKEDNQVKTLRSTDANGAQPVSSRVGSDSSKFKSLNIQSLGRPLSGVGSSGVPTTATKSSKVASNRRTGNSSTSTAGKFFDPLISSTPILDRTKRMLLREEDGANMLSPIFE
uniref:RING-type domain-containing protein n=1 Tax=Strongyloides papillosus TaxID=174720 RepID=A0A0N5BFC3_STREA